MTTLLETALYLASCGLHVVPMREKKPVTPSGFKDATTDKAQITDWWTHRYRGCNVGIACGKKYGILVVEADCHKPEENGIESMQYLIEQHGPFPQTLQVLSGGGGFHYYFKFPEDADIRNSKVPGYPGLEVKSEGCMCAPPSIHPSGGEYMWVTEPHTPIADLPDWLRVLIESHHAQPYMLSGHKGIDEAILLHQSKQAVYSFASDFIELPETVQAKLRVAIRDTFGSSFPMREFDDLLRAERNKSLDESAKIVPVIRSARNLMFKQFPKKKWVVPGVLPTGLIVLAGKQKIGKSWLDYNLGMAIAEGGIALGSIQVEQGDVLYLALEDTDPRLHARFKNLLAPGQVPPAAFEYALEWPRMDADGVAQLEAWIQSKQNPRLIIIDPWIKVKPHVKSRPGETGYDAEYDAFKGIKRLADTYDICILVQFHLRKASAEDPFDELNATTGVTACADGFLSLKRARSEAEAILWGTGRDYAEDVNLALSFDGGFWKVLGDATAYSISKERSEIIEVLSGRDIPMKPQEIAQALGKPVANIRKLLFSMKKSNHVKETEKGYIPLVPALAMSGNAGNGGNAVTF